ncbi:hypothetical protein EVG20_g3509 [Dentipellis fragilis]|uniref:NADH:flavin oxidoreductase/NADH oxidase N-terminal domain-containing protein n=1 Tax=Dentipellis fragilis TaxID=205917 RepID=A0A4Y9Z3U3_9AGAM|nr:hypothetical protein EVG20_g3509 [Dentipellis fragilis]
MPTFTTLAQRIRDAHPDFAYLHVVEPRMNGEEYQAITTESNDALRRIWAPRPFIAAGGFDRAEAMRAADSEGEGVLVAFGRHFISNPDLPRRLKNDWPLAKYDRSTFYTHGPEAVEGYIDYPAYAAT